MSASQTPVSVAVTHYPTIGSTMDEAMARARNGAHGPLWIIADEQTAGRGRHGRDWISRPGNLYSTLLLTDACAPDHAPQLGFVTGVALHETIAAALPNHVVRLKWPNDVLVNGAKISGILLEGAFRSTGEQPRHAIAIGIGVNVAHHPDAMMYPTTSLNACGSMLGVRALFDRLAATLMARIAEWNRGAGFDQIRVRWMDVAAGLGQPIEVRQGSGVLHGISRGIDGQGRLLVDVDGVQHGVHAGDVFL
ncbi:MAG: biotin--[acetyl-CoA-carboxylase] ligase [Beijerinckiaceae bacterium]